MEHELVRRAQQGDHEAFGTLIQGVIARLYATAHLVLRDADRAEDAVQDALVAAWRDLRGLRDPDRLDAWLHRLLVRSCHRVARRERRRAVREVPLAADHDAVAPDVIATLGFRDELERAFGRLSADQRTIIILAYFADLSMADVSVALDIPIGTTKSRLHRAMSALRAAMAADERGAALSTGRIA